VSARVRAALGDLLAGALLQRLAQAAAAVVLARALGVERLGAYAFGLQLGQLLAILADAGPRAVAAREAAARPENAWAWIQASVRVRLLRAGVLFLAFAGAVSAFTREPLFLLLCGAQVFPAILDLKGLAEAVGRTRLEALLESLAAALYLALAGLLVLLGAADPAPLAAAFLAGRCLSALLAAARLPLLRPRRGARSWRAMAGGTGGLSLALLLHHLIRSCDIILLGWLAGPAQAGLFHTAQRLALAAETPLHVLGRLTRPHLHRAAAGGGCAATLERMIRASAFWIVPVAAGGWLVAGPLLAAFFGEPFAAGAWTLRWLLLAALLSGLGSHFGNALFARRRVGPYLRSLGLGMAANLGLSLCFIPLWGSAGTALATALSLAAATGLALGLLLREVAFDPFAPLLRPGLAALAPAGAAWAVPAWVGLPGRLLAGALGLVLALHLLELRGRWRSLGSGLERGSGFGLPGREGGRAR